MREKKGYLMDPLPFSLSLLSFPVYVSVCLSLMKVYSKFRIYGVRNF